MGVLVLGAKSSSVGKTGTAAYRTPRSEVNLPGIESRLAHLVSVQYVYAESSSLPTHGDGAGRRLRAILHIFFEAFGEVRWTLQTDHHQTNRQISLPQGRDRKQASAFRQHVLRVLVPSPAKILADGRMH